MACPHLGQLNSLQPPRLSQSVHREECTQCFDNQDMEGGVDVCLSCFNGGCPSEERHHARSHFNITKHPFTLNVRRTLKPTIKRDDEAAPPVKRLAIIEEREEDKYTHHLEIKCWLCDSARGKIVPDAATQGKGKEVANAIMSSLSSARQSEVKAWEEEIEACEHTVTLEQVEFAPIAEVGRAQCSFSTCGLKENLWLCLTCGNLACGRQQFGGGPSGNGHALLHYNETGHAPAVKLGTITPEGTADVYCYKCDDSKLDLELVTHLATFGINVLTQEKTEKTMTELQIDQNFNYDFSLTDENGKPFETLFGPGLTGLRNLGNSCYMASVLQTMFALQPFQSAYVNDHRESCTEQLPATCILCQLHKMHDGLLSGRYSLPRAHLPQETTASPDSNEPIFQDGLRPAMFKALIGKGHEEFATMRQQDAEEFLTYLFKVIRQDAKKRGQEETATPTESFRFGVEQRLQCGTCKKVRYKVDSNDSISLAIPAEEVTKIGSDGETKTEYEPVELNQCLKLFTQPDGLEYKCPSCKETVVAQKQSRFATFPNILVVHAKKFALVNWVPQKLSIPVLVDDYIVLDEYLGQGVQPGEEQLPEDENDATAPSEPTFDPVALAQLEGMGFPTIRCKKALLANPSDPDAAVQWLFEHMDDPDIDAPLPSSGSGGPAYAADPDKISMLQSMGFMVGQASKALRETDGDVERAVEWLFSHPDDPGDAEGAGDTGASAAETKKADVGGSSQLPARYRLKAFISHKGPSVHSGHYVAHIHMDLGDGKEDWVLFNDEKVVKADQESVDALRKLAYLYIFERV